MAARQVLGSLRLPLAPRGTAMDGGETAKSVVTMTKDFKAYVQHLQDEKFNSRNIACNGMRRLIVSHSKSTSSYTPDEMITLLKTVEKPLLNVLQNEKHTIVIKSVCLLIETFVNLKLTLHDHSIASIFQSFIPTLLKLSVSETVGFSNPSKSCLVRIAKYVNFNPTIVLNIYVKAVRNEALRCGCFELLQQKMCKWQNDNTSIIPSEDLGVLMVLIPMAIADQHTKIRSKCFALFMTVFESWKEEATLIFDNLKPKSKIFLLRDSEKLQEAFPWPRKTTSSTPSETGSTNSRLSSKRREALNAWVNEREKQRQQKMSDLSSSKKARSSASNRRKSSVTKSGNRLSTSKALAKKKERKSKRQLNFDNNDENCSIESNANFFITRDLKQTQVDQHSDSSKAASFYKVSGTSQSLFNSIESECREVFERQISRCEFSKIDDTVANNEWGNEANLLKNETKEQQESTTGTYLTLKPAVNFEQEATRTTVVVEKDQNDEYSEHQVDTTSNIENMDAAVVSEDIYSSVVLDAPVELNKSCSSPEDTLQKQLEEMQKDIEEMTKTQNEAEQAMNVSLLSAKKNKLAISPSVDFSVVQRDLRLLKKKKSSSSSSSLKDQAISSSTSATTVNDREIEKKLSVGKKEQKEDEAINLLKSVPCNTTTKDSHVMECDTSHLSIKQEAIPVSIDNNGDEDVSQNDDTEEIAALKEKEIFATEQHDIDVEEVPVFARSFENHNDEFNAVEEVKNQLDLRTTVLEEKGEAACGGISTFEKGCADQKELEQDGFNSDLQQIDVETELEAFFKRVENDGNEVSQNSRSDTKTTYGSLDFHGNTIFLLLSFATLIAFSMHLSCSKINTSKANLLASSKSPLMLPLPQTIEKNIAASTANDYFSSRSDCFPVITTEEDEREGRNLCYDPVLQMFKDVSFNKPSQSNEEISPQIHMMESIKLQPIPVLHLKDQILLGKQNKLRTAPFVYEDAETAYLVDEQHYVDLTNDVPIILTTEQSMANNEKNEDSKVLSPLMVGALVLTTSMVLIVGIVSSGEENIVNAFCKQAKAVPCVPTETSVFDQAPKQ